MANIDERPTLTRESIERHKDNRVTTIVAGLIIVVAMIAALAFLMNRDRVNNDITSQQTTAAVQAAGAQAAQANADAATANMQANANAAAANLQAQAAAANAAAIHAQNAAERGASRNSLGFDGSNSSAVPSQESAPSTESTPQQ